MAVDVQRMSVEAQIGEVEDCRIDEVPVLDLVAAHHEARPAHAVDQKRSFGRRAVGNLRERLELSRGIGNRRLEDEHALCGGGDFRNAVDLAFDQQRARHAAADLERGCSVQMWVIPVRARRVIGPDSILVPPLLSGLDAELAGRP